MKKPLLIALPLLAVLSAGAQNYSIDWHKIAGGGGTSSGGTYQVSGTLASQMLAAP